MTMVLTRFERHLGCCGGSVPADAALALRIAAVVDVAKREAERLNELGLGDNPDVELVESRVESVPPAVRITHVFEDRAKGERFETEPFTGYD
jgi:hypothetical protein